MTNNQMETSDLWTLGKVSQETSLSEATILSLVQVGAFPKAFLSSPTLKAWKAHDVLVWIEKQPKPKACQYER